MPINDPYADQTAARQVFLRVLSNGTPLAGIISAEITSANHYQCDRFTLAVATSAAGANWWDTEPPLLVDVQVQFEGGSWTSLVQGEVDTERWAVARGHLMLEGRDLSARLIEAKTQLTYQNQTASEIATSLATENGLTPVVAATTTPVGRYYEIDHTRTSMAQFSKATTEWDLLVYLAQQEGFDVFVSGQSLYFQPETQPDADPFVVAWSGGVVPVSNVLSIQCERSLTLAKDIQVDVKSWNSRTKAGFTKSVKAAGARTATAIGATASSKSNNTQRYVFVKPNLTEDQALQFAQQQLTELSRHERVVDVQMPGELVLTARNLVRLEGTGTSWDQTYFIDSISRSLSFESGFQQHLRLKNTSPRSQAIVQ